ncbi:MAG TPA: 5'/3'-nucleotidase SurE [Casimicrobiaceae bacterium]|jgi:5'-nucleotidase|nr:5'/3'-nucleotidase SurE [Casimicrobiaceae bacterium]
MRILVSNDDGIHSPGVRLLAQAAIAIGSEVWVVAPERKWTAASHQLSFDRELTLTRMGDRVYACSGAPADCVVAAMTVLFGGGSRPDLVLAGINDKRNVAEDSAYSGTTAIAREATFWGVPAISLSREQGETDGAGDLEALCRLLRLLWNGRADWAAEGHWLNINLPGSLPAPLIQARIGRDKIGAAADILGASPERIRYRLRRGRPGTITARDENACLDAGQISVVRYCWFAEARLPDGVFAAWQAALG